MTTLLALIARDEEETLPRCLNSAASLTDDILIIEPAAYR